jgi:hypothetical protein
MIITLIAIALIIIGIVLAETRADKDIAIPLLISGIVGTIFCGLVILFSHINQDAELQQLKAEREALVYQLENGIYYGDALGEFNSDLIYNQKVNQNPWFNWFHGDYIMEVEPIALE